MAVRQGPNHISAQRHRIAELARRNPGVALTSLNHYIDLQWMYEAYYLTRKDGAVGLDGVTAEEYQKDLDGNLKRLLEAFKSGSYRAPVIRRVEIPKGDGKKSRKIGITTFEDKILQRAVTMVLQEVYEKEFYNFSYGFRPGRSQHMALKSVMDWFYKTRGGWVLEVDLKAYFDKIVHRYLRGFLDQRVSDGVIRRMVDKWLKAGVLEENVIIVPEEGTPQGGVISPMISNIFLHGVLDKWFVEHVQPRLIGQAQIVRYADDFMIMCTREDDAKRVLEAMNNRFHRYGLEVNPEKTRLVRMYPPKPQPKGKLGRKERETLELLGFTLYWGKTRKGFWVLKPKTSAKRLRRSLKAISIWCQRNRHLKLKVQAEALARKLTGHYQYYGVSFNSESLQRFLFQVKAIWKKWLSRRSQRGYMNWKRFNDKSRQNPLPTPRIYKPMFGS